MAGREFETAQEADEWLSYALVQKEQDIEMESRVQTCFGLVNCLMRECSMVDSAHFTLPASGEIFLALNILSVTVQMSTGKTP